MRYYATVLGVFKNEASFLGEWIEHYLARGIEHIYLLNDSSTDNFLDITTDYVNKGLVTLKSVEECDQDKTISWRQAYLYNKYYNYILKESFWIGVFDLDEFFYCTQYKNITKILNIFEKASYQELLADWYWFGSNNHVKQPKNIVESFTKRAKHTSRHYNFEKEGYHHEWCCKSFAKTKFIKKIKHHFNEFNYYKKQNFCSEGKRYFPKFSLNLSKYNFAYINHYLGSEEYYKQKEIKGSCNNSLIVRDKNLYNLLNMNDIVDKRLLNQNDKYK